MAGYRQIHTQIWKDEWFIELKPDEKFLFIYLFSNELSSISGLYKIPIRVMHNETGIPIERIEEIVSRFIADEKIQYESGTVWIKNMWRYHKNASARTQIKVWNDINSIPDCIVKRDCIQYLYGIGMDTLDVLKAKAKAKANHNENENENDEITDLPSSPLEAAFVEASGMNGLLPNPRMAFQAYETMQKAGVEPQDIKNAVHILIKKGYSIVGPSSIVNSAITEMQRRKNSARPPVPEPAWSEVHK